MGYRSEVLMVIGAVKPRMAAFTTQLALLYPEVAKHVFSEEQGFARKKWGSGGEEWELLYLYECDTKWYRSYEDVGAFHAAFDNARDLSDKLDLHGTFLRIGEDTADIEEEMFGDYEVTSQWGEVSRCISRMEL